MFPCIKASLSHTDKCSDSKRGSYNLCNVCFKEHDMVTRKRRRTDPPHGMGGYPPYGAGGGYGGGGGSYGSPGMYDFYIFTPITHILSIITYCLNLSVCCHFLILPRRVSTAKSALGDYRLDNLSC